MTMVKVNPMHKTFNGMVNEFLNEFPATVSKSLREDVLHYPPVNIRETPDAYFVSLSAPGLQKADFKVKLENKILTISSEKKEETLNENDKMVRTEFGIRNFRRSFTIDEKIEVENISARYENGIMTLELPKREVAKAVSKEIEIL